MSSFASTIMSQAGVQPDPSIYGMVKDTIDTAIRNIRANPKPREDITSGQWGIPPQDTYAAKYQSGTDTYYAYFDEAIRTGNWENALAMRRDIAIREPLEHRQMATASLDYYLKPDNPEDKDQMAVVDQLESVIENISSFKLLVLNLLEDIFFGKFGSQLCFGYESIKGCDRLTVIDHAPVIGDKIQYRYDGTPGILFNSTASALNGPEYVDKIGCTTQGKALFLTEPWLRDRFIISRFKTSDFDYIREGEKALAVHGIGKRDDVFWAWQVRTEVWSWILDAIQRVGANGMTIGFYQEGNAAAKSEMITVIKQLVKDNYSVVGAPVNAVPQNMIHNIPVSPVGYEVMLNIVKYLDDFIRRSFLGQELTSTSRATGMGSGVAAIQESAFDNIIGYDSYRIAETLTKQLIKVLLRYNTWTYKGQEVKGDQLPFAIRLKFDNSDDDKGKEQSDVAKTLHEMGVSLDKEDILDKTGFSAPHNPLTVLEGKEDAPEQPMLPPGGATQGNGVPGQNPALNGQAPKPGFTPGDKSLNGIGNPRGKSHENLEMFGSPDQPRDEDGKWTSGSGSSSSQESDTKKERNIIVHRNEKDQRSAVIALFGRRVSDETIASMAGAPGGSKVNIVANQPNKERGQFININWDLRDSGAYASRRITKEGDRLIMNNVSFTVDKEHQGKGLGSKVFSDQIDHAKRIGIKEIRTEALRDDNEGAIGYKVWPMFGYDGDIPSHLVDDAPNGEKRLSDLMRTKEGRSWWSEHGDSVELTFDLSDDSESMKTWNAYKANKAKK